jgi:para-nitrobenzyl esterase
MIAAVPALTRRAALGGGVALLGASALRAGAGGDPVVTCRAGRFAGTRSAGVAAFRGIRYGRAARFRAPEPVAPTPATIDALAPAAACPQHGKRHPQSEDCLALNIWSPALHPEARLPVLVYVHGGGYAYGSANDAITDGQALAARGALVVVTVNHRLNLFGYLYLARLDRRFGDSGNAGQLDLILALAWVRDNIAAFGGDPRCVTLAGQSGGGAKIATLMAMPAARGLFHRALTMSGQQVTISGPVHATHRARACLAQLGIAERDVARLAELPPERLLDALDADDPVERSKVYMGPVLDGTWLTRHPFWPDAHPAGREVPLMLGGTRDETRDFTDPASPALRDLSWAELPDRIAAELPVDLSPEAVVRAYRAHMPTATPADIFYAATTDGRSWRPQLIEAEARDKAGCPAYVYQLDFASPTLPERGAFHGIDIALLFGTLDAPDAWTGTGAEARRLSRLFQDRVIAFAQSGVPRWPPYRLPRRTTMIFDTASRTVDNPRAWQRALFAVAPYTQPGS